MAQWLDKQRSQAQATFDEFSLQFKYGLTIRLDKRGLDIEAAKAINTEQVITIENTNCQVKNIFDCLDDAQVQQHLLKHTTAPIAQYIAAHFDIGMVVTVEPGQQATLTLSRTIQSPASKEYILVIAKENSSITIIDQKQSTACKLNAGVVEVICKQNASVKYATIQKLDAECFDIYANTAHIEKNGKVDWLTATFGSRLSKHETKSILAGERAVANMYGVYFGNNKQQFDISASSLHQANQTSSDMYTRGVLDDRAKAIYRGLIDIHAEAFGCDGYQKEETILLSEHAVADAIPNLQIRNNDVKCSHGATIGKVDDEQLFYLTSRGIDPKAAVRMIVEGYFTPVTKKLDWSELDEILKPLIEEKMKDAE